MTFVKLPDCELETLAKSVLANAKLSPSPKQVETFEDAMRLWKTSAAKISAEIDPDDSTMIIFVVDDGVQSFARFRIDGTIEGDWIY